MARRGGRGHLKRLVIQKFVPIAKKAHVWAAKSMPGAHPMERSVPLIILVRDLLKLADNAKEARRIIRSGEVLVDGRAIKRERFPVGLMDVLSIPKMSKHYRVLVDAKERVKFVDVSDKEAKYKLCQINRKSMIRGSKIQLGLHDGRNFVGENKYRVGDTVKLEVPTQKVLGTYKLEPNARCLIVSGKHAGTIVELSKVHPRSSRRPTEATVRANGSEFITVKRYLFPIGSEMQ